MEQPEFYIQPKKYIDESTVISMRLPKDMLADIDRLAKETGRTRNEILSLCMEFALEHYKPSDMI